MTCLVAHCAACTRYLPAAAFYRDRSRATGLRPYCKTCDLARRARYYAANLQEQRAYHRRYYRLRRKPCSNP